MKNTLFTVLGILFLVCNLSLSGTFAASTKQFSDVPSSKYFAEAVNDLAERNIIGGYPDGTFKPGNTITRGQAAAIIAKMINLDTSNVKNPGFQDVSTANNYYKAIAAMTEEGIINGYGDGRYGPNDPIKRGQMASILVKAFDLPRYSFDESKNPFKDVDYYANSHSTNIYIIYKLGITGGTSADKFSPNAFITRGQAAKLLKASEEAKPSMLTLKANDLNLDRIFNVGANEINAGVFEGIVVSGKNLSTGYTGDKVQLIPLKEGKSTLVVVGEKANKQVSQKYYVHSKKENGELKLTLEDTDDSLPREAALPLWNDLRIYWLGKEISKSREVSFESVQNVSLTTMDGKKLSENVKFEKCNDGNDICINIDQPGQYIATVLMVGGVQVRYGIEVKPNNSSFYYQVRVVKEQTSDLFDMGQQYNIGKHTPLRKDIEKIATVIRDPGTNLYRVQAIGHEEGTFHIGFNNIVIDKLCYETFCESNVEYEISLFVDVQRIGSIVNVHIQPSSFRADSDA